MSEDLTPQENINEIIPVSGLFENYFLDYASYVILERAIPALEDGLKPVQRRILHSMFEMEDGRFHKVANVIGQSMQYHPHGDAAIGEAMVNMGQKNLLIDTQGNWGDIRTGDSAAAPRYIEARLSKFALEVGFNKKTTHWQLSYDGRKKEPITLPMKFPLLLAQGVEGIAVGLSTKILPHNFCELIDASIKVLKNQPFEIYPDFLTGGLIDVSDYKFGERGGKVRIRAKIEELDKKTLVIRELPYGTTTDTVIDSILKANDKGKVKIKQVIDNTAKDLEIVIHLPPGVSPDISIDALFAFTQCEVSVSPNACVIVGEKPIFTTVNHLLKKSTEFTQKLLQWELEIHKSELMEDWHFSSLEKIFIENRIYRDIEECETWEDVISTIDKGLDPFKKLLRRTVTTDDIVQLTEIKIKRISKFDAFKADEHLKGIEDLLAEVEINLANIIEFTIDYFKRLLNKFGKGRQRKTEIKSFDTINFAQVAIANQKLYVNRVDGFVGTSIKKDEYIGDCSDLDNVIVFRKDGKYSVSKVSDKAFFGKDIIHVAVFHKSDERNVYNIIYLDGKSGVTYAKRFNVTSVTRDKEYDVTKGEKNSKVLYFTDNANGESEIITVTLSQIAKARKKVFDFNFGNLAIKGRSSQGITVTKFPVKKIAFKEKGQSSFGGVKIWYDESISRLNKDERGRYLGEFDSDNHILIIYKDGSYELTDFELSNRFENEQIYLMEKLRPSRGITIVHYDPSSKNNYCKRFLIETTTINKRFKFISEEKDAKLLFASTAKHPTVLIKQKDGKKTEELEHIDLEEFIEVKGWKANGNKISEKPILSVELISIAEEVEEEEVDIEEVDSEEEDTDNEGGTDKLKNLKIGSTVEFDIKNPDDKASGDQLKMF